MIVSRLSQFILIPRLSHMVIGMAVLMLILRLSAMAEIATKDSKGEPELSKEQKVTKDMQKKSDPVPQPSPPIHKENQEEAKSSNEIDPLLLDEAQVKVLMTLADRRKEIDKQEEEMKKRHAMIVLSEKKLTAQLEKLQEIKSYIEKNKPAGMVSPEENVKRMVKVYEGMKPAAAAKIFDKMGLETLIQVIQGMSQKKAGTIMALMDPVRAREVTSKMITLQIPLPAPNQSKEKKG